MNVQVENLEKNMAKLTIEVDAAELDKAINKAYNRQKSRIAIPGFRKGKVPRQIIEKMYGEAVFFDEASDILVRETYSDAYDESGLDIVSQPEIEVVTIEKGEPFVYTATVAVKPEVKLGKYKGVEVTAIDTDVSEEEIDQAMEREQELNARTVEVERPVEDGDTVNIDFDGFMEDKRFDGGKGENYPLVIGSGSFIPGFEEQLIGASKGDNVDVNVTFPEDYHEEKLAGKPALFKVKVNSISAKEMPELDDDFAADAGYDTIAEFREEKKKELVEVKEKNARREQTDEAVRKIVEDSEMDIPDAMLDFQVEQMLQEMAGSLMQQGMTLEQYAQFTGQTPAQLRAQMRPDALERTQGSLVLEAVAKAENIEATDEDVDKEIEEMAKMYGMKAEDLKKNMQETETENMKKDIAVQKAADFVVDNAKPKKATSRKKKAEKKEEDTETKED